MSYITVFDASQNSSQLAYPLLIFVFSSIAIALGWGLRGMSDKAQSAKGILFYLVGGVGILGSFVFFAFTYSELLSARRAIATGDYHVVEGVVENFVPMPPGGHSTESFTVNGVKFAYGSGWGSVYFNSEWNKGVLRNGVRTRITYRGNEILKVEVAKPTPSQSSR